MRTSSVLQYGEIVHQHILTCQIDFWNIVYRTHAVSGETHLT